MAGSGRGGVGGVSVGHSSTLGSLSMQLGVSLHLGKLCSHPVLTLFLQVVLQRFLADEAIPAVGTLIGALPGVTSHMGHQVGLAAEALGAAGTVERLVPGVTPEMSGQGGVLPEALPTLVTGERPIFRVRLPVGRQVLLLHEGLAADAAAVGSVLTVPHLVG